MKSDGGRGPVVFYSSQPRAVNQQSWASCCDAIIPATGSDFAAGFSAACRCIDSWAAVLTTTERTRMKARRLPEIRAVREGTAIIAEALLHDC